MKINLVSLKSVTTLTVSLCPNNKPAMSEKSHRASYRQPRTVGAMGPFMSPGTDGVKELFLHMEKEVPPWL